MGRITSLLRAAGGEVPLDSPFGRWAMKLSLALDGNSSDASALKSFLNAVNSEETILSSYGLWMQRITSAAGCSQQNPSPVNITALLRSTAGEKPNSGALSRWARAVSSHPLFRAIVPPHILDSPLDNDAIIAPVVMVNTDPWGAPQEEPSIAVDPTDPNRLVAVFTTGETGTWSCVAFGLPCSAVYGTQTITAYYSIDGGATWCDCASTDPNNIGGLLPGLVPATGGDGTYNAVFDSTVAFDSQGNVYVAGEPLHANLQDSSELPTASATSVNKGVWDGTRYVFGAPTFLNPAGLPSLNDSPWIEVDANPLSPNVDNVYVSWTVFTFGGPIPTGSIVFSFSTDGGATYSAPADVSGAVGFSSKSRPIVAPNGDVYVVFQGTPNPLAQLVGIWIARSTDGGATFGAPVEIAPVTTMLSPHDTVFRAHNSPGGVVAPNGDLYVTWTLEVDNAAVSFDGQPGCEVNIVGEPAVRANCKGVAVYSVSSDDGATWSAPALVFTQGDRVAEGYPVAQPSGGTLDAPATIAIEDVAPAIAITPAGDVLISAYRSKRVSPWQLCAVAQQPIIPVGDISCLQLDDYVDNGRLDYVVKNLTTGIETTLTTHPVNSRYQFGGTFIGDFTDLAVGSDGVAHAVWTDTNSVKRVHWAFGFEFNPGCTRIHNQEVVTRSGSF